MPIFKKTKCFMKWCYSPSRHEDGTCDKFCTYNTVYAQTNADHIRSMTDEELAELFEMIPHLGNPSTYTIDGFCIDDGLKTKKQWLEWLEKEVESEGG